MATSNLLNMNVGGVNVSYDLGPSVADQASASQTFLSNQFAEDSAFVQNNINSSQSFLSGFAAPIINAATQQQNFNDTVLPSMFSTLEGDNFSIGQSAIGADTLIAQSSIAASQASAQEANSAGGGGCYITTAVCEVFKLPDNCDTLNTLRKFRDGYMMATPERRALVREYYTSAPANLSAIRRMPDANDMFRLIYIRYIRPAVLNIKNDNNARAFALYCEAVNTLRGKVIKEAA